MVIDVYGTKVGMGKLAGKKGRRGTKGKGVGNFKMHSC
jgi:hypothetical protein